MFAALLRLGNEISMFFQPIPSASGTDKCVEIRLSMDRMQIQKTFSFRWRTVLCVSFFFFFFVNSLPLWNHTGYHKSTNYRWGKISMLFHVQFCRSYYVRKMRIYLAIDDTRRILNLSLIFLVANVFSNNFQDASRAFLRVYIYENFQIKCEDLKTRTWIKIFFLFLHMEQPFVDI